MKVKLIRVNGGEALRSDSVIGDAIELPKVGSRFIVVAEPITSGANMRYIRTSEIKKVDQSVEWSESEKAFIGSNLYVFETESGSVYQVEVELEN